MTKEPTAQALRAGDQGSSAQEADTHRATEKPVVDVADFLRERDANLEPGEADDAERKLSAETIIDLIGRTSVRADRLAELGDFIGALFEWGADDPHDQAEHIIKFLNDPDGLEPYREREIARQDAKATGAA